MTIDIEQAVPSVISEIRHPLAEQDLLTRASMQLDAIHMGLEIASQSILDAAERIGELIDDARQGDDRAVERIADCIIDIYENCEFQDISGQRLNNVSTALDQVSTSVDQLISLVGSDVVKDMPLPAGHLTGEPGMSGPQLAGEGTRQTDIDQLFE